jgi:hypothetical protein
MTQGTFPDTTAQQPLTSPNKTISYKRGDAPSPLIALGIPSHFVSLRDRLVPIISFYLVEMK